MSSFRKIIIFIVLAIFVVGGVYVGISYATTNYVPGTIVGRSYVNSSMNMRVDLPDNFSFQSAKGVVEGAEMFAVATDRLCNVVVVSEPVFPLIPINLCVSSIEDQMTEEAMNTYKTKYTFTGTTSRRLAGEEYSFVRGEMTIKGIQMNQDIYLRKTGSRFLAIIISYTPSTYQSTSERDNFIKCMEQYN